MKLFFLLIIFAISLFSNTSPVDTSLNSSNWFEWIGKNWFLAGLLPAVAMGVVLWFWGAIKSFLQHWWLFINDFLRKINYRYIGLRKHVTVYKNGHGIILHDIELKIYRPNENFEKAIDISDGQTQCIFPSLDEMKRTHIEDRFKSFGFWYSSTPPGVISDVVEVQSRSNPKKKTLKFTFNPHEVKKLNGHSVKILYGISVPNLYPLNNGIYNASLGGENPIKSEFEVKYPLSYLTYVIGLEDGISVNSREGIYYPRGEGNIGTDIAIKEKDDLFYNKYSMDIKNPKVGSLISTRFGIA